MIPAVIIESMVTNAASPTIHPASIQTGASHEGDLWLPASAPLFLL